MGLINGISLKHERFAVAYLIKENATEAARIAGFSDTTNHGLAVAGHLALQNAAVKEYIRKYTEEKLAQMQVDAAWAMKRLVYIADSDPRELFDDEGKLVPPHKWTPEFAASVQAMDVWKIDDEGRPIGFRVRHWDKNKALERIAQHFGMFDEKGVETTDPVDEEDRTWTVEIVKAPALEAPMIEIDDDAKPATS